MKPKIMAQMRQKMAAQNYKQSTIDRYVTWLVDFINFYHCQHPSTLGAADIEKYLIHLAVQKNYSSISQNQALSAIRYLYREILNAGIDGQLARLRAKTGRHLPETAAPGEINQLFDFLPPKYYLMACLVYGAGLTISECATLRIYNLDFANRSINLANRQTIMPERIQEHLNNQMIIARLAPGNIDEYLFPSSRLHKGRCWHISPSSLQKALKQAVGQAGITKSITPRVLRHSFALHLRQAHYDIRTIQELLGHKDIRSTMVYQKLLDNRDVKSPLDE